MLLAWLWPLVAVTLGGSPHAPHPHFGAPQSHSHDDPEGLFWDHAAIWGAQEAREQRELPPEESRRSESARLDRDRDGVVTWEEFRAESFGDTEDFGGSPDPDSHRKLLERSRRRFRAADEDGDGRLGPHELDAFLHPEDFPRLQDLVVQETIEDLDRDGDGFIQVDEYIADLFEGPPGSPEPPEIQREREQFLKIRDQDQDGRLGPPEVKLWLSPPSPDWAGVEAEHLIHHADLDQGPPGSPEPPEIQREREQFLKIRDQDQDGRLGPPEVKLWLSPPSPDWAGVEAEHLIHHADLDQ
ncbi:reticulocalbin-3-like, partial [Passer montanus]|uniref:reticulocalbin-3-like n=1 Tax=Passer montanus TaxID=9160 RepID=UPI001961BA95